VEGRYLRAQPVPTALLAEYVTKPGQHAAAMLYSSTCFLMAICFNLLWRYASYHNRLLGKDIDIRSVKAIDGQFLFGPLLYLIVMGVSFISTLASIILCFILAIFLALPGRPLRSLPETVEMKDESKT
jgi:hypothetical protein